MLIYKQISVTIVTWRNDDWDKDKKWTSLLALIHWWQLSFLLNNLVNVSSTRLRCFSDNVSSNFIITSIIQTTKPTSHIHCLFDGYLTFHDQILIRRRSQLYALGVPRSVLYHDFGSRFRAGSIIFFSFFLFFFFSFFFFFFLFFLINQYFLELRTIPPFIISVQEHQF